MNELTLGESAEYLAEMGYRVFPLVPGKKTPLIEGWTEKATDDEETVRAWWQNTPNANIGICTTGLLVVDVDVKNGLPFWFKRHQQKLENATSTIARTWSGGYHYYFNDPTGLLKNTVGVISEGIDTRAWHGYVVAPPSVVEGKPYAWKHINFEERKELFDGPIFVLEDLRKGDAAQKKKVQLEGGVFPDAIEDGVREISLYKLAVELRGLGLGYDEMIGALMKFNELRCKPPKDRKTVETKAKSAMKLDPHQCSEFLLAESEKQITVVIDSRRVDADGNELVPKGSLTSEVESLDENDEKVENECPKFSESILYRHGLINEIVDYTLTHAHRPNRTLAFAGALSLVSFLAGKVFTSGDTFPNIYTLVVAPSGSGKNAPLKTNQQILNELGKQDLYHQNIGSNAALAERMAKEKFLFQCDECSKILRAASNPKGTSDLSAFAETMNEIFTSSDMEYSIRGLKGGTDVKVSDPHFVFSGTTTPRLFYENINIEMVTEGLISRCLVFDSKEFNELKDADDCQRYKPPTMLILMAKAFDDLIGTIWGNGNWPGQEREPIDLKDAKSISEETYQDGMTIKKFIQKYFETLTLKSVSKGDEISKSVYVRMMAYVKKLALLSRASKFAYEYQTDRKKAITPSEMEIDMDDYLWAFEFCKQISEQMIWNLKTNYGQNDNEKALNKILNCLRKKGGTVSHVVLTRNTHLSSKDFRAYIDTLIERNLIEVTLDGRKKCYRLI